MSGHYKSEVWLNTGNSRNKTTFGIPKGSSGNVPTYNEAVSIEVVRDFWTKILGTVGKVSRDDPGVKEWRKETKKRVGRTPSESPNSIDETKLRKALKKAKSWSALWPDGIHTFGG